MSSLYLEQFGTGPDLVLVHGWGLHGGVFNALAERLAARYRITLVDLPGHGRSPAPEQQQNLSTLADSVAAVTPSRATWLGWSLGGMIAAQLALNAPMRVDKLILVASSPRFITGTGWPYAMDPAVLAGFAQELQEDYRGTLDRFLSLHVGLNTAAGRDTLRQLREMLFQFPSPAPQALRDGLAILSSADLRAQLPALRCPVLYVLGERDRLVPVGVGAALTALLPAAQIQIVTGAGHAPFLSHQTEFLAALAAFLESAHD